MQKTLQKSKRKSNRKYGRPKNKLPAEPAVKITKIAEGFKVSPLEEVLIGGDLGVLTPEQRFNYYLDVCKSLRLNPLTVPFGYISIEGVMKLYPKKDCTEQLRKLNGIGITEMTKEYEKETGILTVTVKGLDKWGKVDIASGSLHMKSFYWEKGRKIEYDLKGQERANAMMKCETKAKRRLTLSMSGLSMPDESEVVDIQGVKILETEERKTEKFMEKVKALPVIETVQVPKVSQPVAAPVQVKTQKEKSMYDVFNSISTALKQELSAAGMKTPYEVYQGYQQVAGDLDALFQLAQERQKKQRPMQERHC